MPKRLVDGEALWRSDKLAQVQPLEFRAEYANLIPLAKADGSFEASPRRVWSDVYSYNRPDITVDLVEEILDAFEKVGMISRKSDENGKVWGKFIGIEARLPSESTKDRYSKGKAILFNDTTESRLDHEEVMIESRQDHDQVMLGLVRFGIGLDSNRSGAVAASEPIFQEGMYPSKNPKRLHKNIVESWQKIKGISAVARYPSRYPQKWEEICENHSGDLIIPAFELWAKEEGIYLQTEYPVADFLKVSGKYMDRIVPTVKVEKHDLIAETIEASKKEFEIKNEEFLRKEKEEAAVAKLSEGVPF